MLPRLISLVLCLGSPLTPAYAGGWVKQDGGRMVSAITYSQGKQIGAIRMRRTPEGKTFLQIGPKEEELQPNVAARVFNAWRGGTLHMPDQERGLNFVSGPAVMTRALHLMFDAEGEVKVILGGTVRGRMRSRVFHGKDLILGQVSKEAQVIIPPQIQLQFFLGDLKTVNVDSYQIEYAEAANQWAALVQRPIKANRMDMDVVIFDLALTIQIFIADEY